MIQYSTIETILQKPELAVGLEKYKFLMDNLQKTDASVDDEYQRVFRDFYRMCRFYSDAFAKHDFILLEQLKYEQDISFRR